MLEMLILPPIERIFHLRKKSSYALPLRHNAGLMLAHWCFNVGPPSLTLDQHQTSIASTRRAHWNASSAKNGWSMSCFIWCEYDIQPLLYFPWGYHHRYQLFYTADSIHGISYLVVSQWLVLCPTSFHRWLSNRVNTYHAEIFCIKQSRNVLVSYFRFIWIHILWLYGN